MNNNFSSIKGAIIIVVILFLIIVAHYLRLIRPIERLVQHGINIVGTPMYDNKTASVSWLTGYICPANSSAQDLQERLNVLTEENAQLSQSVREFEQIKEISEYTNSHKQRTVAAHIVGTVNQPGTHALILDKGLSDGVKEQFAVIASHGIIIGKTALVTDTTSQLILLNDRRSTLAVSLLNNAKATGLVQGEFGLGLVMRMIPSNEKIETNDVVVSSGFENGIPGGLIIGNVGQIHHDDAALFADATISPPIRYDQLNVVSIILPQ